MRRALLTLLVLALSVVALPVSAQAAKAKKLPTITRVAPMRITVGKTLTIRGKNFSSSRRRNTVVFRAPNGRSAFAKPRRASHSKLVVKVPGSVERLLKKKSNKPIPTRFRIRVVTRRFGKLTPRRLSPVIVSSVGTDGAGACGSGDDVDNDLLSKSLETLYKTDPCLADTDGDGVDDGFEVRSALDLNQNALPYPGKRPFPNALDPSDSGHDYDGDGLSNIEEFRAWAHASASPAASALQAYTGNLDAPGFAGPYGDHPRFGGHTLPMNYSDGKQATISVPSSSAEYKSYLDLDNDGRLTDDERDVDGDGLGNATEIRGLMWQEWYPADKDCGYEYRPVLPRVFLQVDYLDTDSDGDGVWDGNDDQDNDGVSNVDEIQAPYMLPGHPLWDVCGKIYPLPVDGARNASTTMWDGSPMKRHPYNPCLPYRSDTCARYVLRD